MKRRTVLKTSGAVLTPAAAGCLSDSSTPDESQSEADTDTDTEPELVERTTIETVDVSSTVFHTSGGGGLGVSGVDDRWAVLVSLTVEGPTPRREEFTLQADSETYAPWTELDGFQTRELEIYRGEKVYDATRGTGWLGFTLPTGDGEPRLVVEGEGEPASWPLGTDVADKRSSQPPSFTTALAGPDSSEADDSFRVTMSMDNDGGDGMFRGVLRYDAGYHVDEPVEERVKADTTRSVQRWITGHVDGPAEAGDEYDILLVTRDEEQAHTVTLE